MRRFWEHGVCKTGAMPYFRAYSWGEGVTVLYVRKAVETTETQRSAQWLRTSIATSCCLDGFGQISIETTFSQPDHRAVKAAGGTKV